MRFFSSFAAIGLVLAALPAYAAPQGKSAPVAKPEWDISVGLGYGVAPSYEGSGHYASIPVPMVNVNWKDTVVLGAEGLDWIALKDGNLRAGVGATYDLGRDERNGSLPWNGRDNRRLVGLGDVDGAFGGRLFASYALNPVVIDGTLTQFFGSDIDGLTFRTGVSMPHQFNQQLRITPGISTTWASDGYMSPFFTITPAQAAASVSGLRSYEAEAGFKDITAGVNAVYFIDPHWYAMGDIRLKQLLGDAADSPISEDDTSGQLVTGVGYRF